MSWQVGEGLAEENLEPQMLTDKLLILITVCILLRVCGAIDEKDRALSDDMMPRMNIQQVADFYITVVRIFGDEKNLENYEIYFDETLREMTRYMFARIGAYATNKKQAVEWRAKATKFVRAFIVNTFLAQCGAYFDAYVAYQEEINARKSNTEPASLLQLCVREFDAQLIRYDYRINDTILLYEFSRLAKLPLIASSINRAPHLRIRIDARYPSARYMIKPGGHVRSAKGNTATLYLIPYSPIQNLAKEIELLYQAYHNSKLYSMIYAINGSYLEEYVDSNLLNFTSLFIEDFLPAKDSLLKRSIISHTFYEIVSRFLGDEYKRLLCHPAYDEHDNKNASIYKHMRQLMQTISETREALATAYSAHRVSRYFISHRATESYNWLIVAEAVDDFLDKRDLRVGFSLLHDSRVFVIDRTPSVATTHNAIVRTE